MLTRAVIFDLDGLLADTEILHCRAYVAALGEMGVTLTNADYEEHWIRRGLGIVELCQQRQLAIDPLAARARKLALYESLVRTNVDPMPGAHELVNLLRPTYALAIGTSSTRQSAELVLNTLGFAFSIVTTADDVAKTKPSPDIFIEAARRLGVEPAHCVVLEDAEKGVIAAAAAGMKSIAVPNRHTINHDFRLASRVVPSLVGLTLQDFSALLDRA
jgi:HAD superfamily hydrolase (TIGR01509 family)